MLFCDAGAGSWSVVARMAGVHWIGLRWEAVRAVFSGSRRRWLELLPDLRVIESAAARELNRKK
jgi:hypothetical protein